MKLFCRADHSVPPPEIVVINGRKCKNPLLYTIKGKRRRQRIIVKHSPWMKLKKRYWKWNRKNKKENKIESKQQPTI